MYVLYGNSTSDGYRHSDNLTGFSMDIERIRNERSGNHYLERRTVNISGIIKGSGATTALVQADIRTQLNNLRAAYSVVGYPWGLYHDDGTPSAHYLPLDNLLGPIHVTVMPSFPTSGGPEYATQRSYTITLVAEYLINTIPEIISFQESVSIRGSGGPRKIITETALGFPRVDVTALHTAVHLTQSGRAVGLTHYPNPPLPLLGTAAQLVWHEDTAEISRDNQERHAYKFIMFPIAWQYVGTATTHPGDPLPNY